MWYQSFWYKLLTQVAYNEGRVAETNSSNIWPFLYMHGVLSGTSTRSFYHGIGGTYLVWMDCHRLSTLAGTRCSDWLTKPDYGSMQEQCTGLKERILYTGISACPRTTLAEGLKRFAGFVRNL